MDYVFWSALKRVELRQLVISYDIACQWIRKLMVRRVTLPKELVTATESISKANCRAFIPKFHIYAHGQKCQASHSLNFSRWVGRTDGENIERGWAWINLAALSTREMGPGARRDTLDDQWSFWNWRILVRLGAPFPRLAMRTYSHNSCNR